MNPDRSSYLKTLDYSQTSHDTPCICRLDYPSGGIGGEDRRKITELGSFEGGAFRIGKNLCRQVCAHVTSDWNSTSFSPLLAQRNY